jgi:hypothetical protein
MGLWRAMPVLKKKLSSRREAYFFASPEERGTALSLREALDVGKAVFGELLR